MSAARRQMLAPPFVQPCQCPSNSVLLTTSPLCSSDDETPRVARSCQLSWSFLSELFPITRQTRRGRSTKSAASSASLRSVLRGVPTSARMVRPRAKSVTWIARAATGKSDGISPALIPSRKRRSTSAAPPATRALQEPLNLSVVHKRRDAHQKAASGGPFLRSHFRRRTSESPRSSREDPGARGVPSRLMRPSVLRTP